MSETCALFLSAWLLGWSIGPLLMTSILALMLFGREVIKARPGIVEIFIGIPLVGITAQYEVSKMRNLRFERPPKKSSKSWRGSHMVFDYGANSVAVGSAISSAELAGPFFVGHFGGFMSIHFLFIYTLLVKGLQGDNGSDGELAEVAQLFVNLWPALAALFVSHAFSFFRNFLGRHEYRGRTLKNQMTEPYSRIVFMHLVLIFGGGLTLIAGQLTPVLLIVIGLKIFFDVKAHRKQRSQGGI